MHFAVLVITLLGTLYCAMYDRLGILVQMKSGQRSACEVYEDDKVRDKIGRDVF